MTRMGSVQYLFLTQLLRSEELLDLLLDTMMIEIVDEVNNFPGLCSIHSPVWPLLDHGVYWETTEAGDALRHLLSRDVESRQQTGIIITSTFLRERLQDRKEYYKRRYGVCLLELCRRH